MSEYKADLTQRFWKYQKSRFPTEQSYFDREYAPDGRPPVFTRPEAWRNIIINPSSNQQEKDKLLSLIHDGERHKWFGSMHSSQALAQSILGNLAIHGFLYALSELNSDEELPLFGSAQFSSDNFSMEHKIDFLGEPRQTNLDGFISGDYQIAIECKFTEPEVGTCSRPRLLPTASNYESELCNGNYSIQRSRKERCSLTEIGVAYWKYIPHLFNWKNDIDLSPCPLNRNYQLVRNILAVGVKLDKSVSSNHGHAILIYDDRNPSCQQYGDILRAYSETRDALIEPKMLRKISWQRIVNYMRNEKTLSWLTEQIDLKYGM